VSILLEALRKSEKEQNPPEVPDIHADDDSTRQLESVQTGPLAILLVLALFISGWFVWNQYQAPAGVYRPPVTLDASTARSGNTPAAAVTTIQKTETPAAATLANNTEGRPRTPVESYQEAIKRISKEPAAGTNQPAPAKQKPAPVQNVKASNSRPAAVKRAEKPQSQIPAPISYWELPDSIRADVPEIKFSVLVYAKNADDRFVLINGQRLGEGDSAQAGLVVEEIRRDGVIFSYRLYQFLVER